MDRAQKVAILNRVLHGTVNSVVQYIEIAVPYVPPGCEEARKKLAALRDAEARTATELTDLIAGLDGVPEVGVFPYWNVDLNYLDLRFLARFAAQHQEKVIGEVEGEIDLVRTDPRLHGALSRILEEKREHLAVLQEIGTPPPPPKPKPEKAKPAAKAGDD